MKNIEDTISSCKDPKMEQELNKWKNSRKSSHNIQIYYVFLRDYIHILCILNLSINILKILVTIIFKNMMACKASIQESKSCFKKELASFKDIKEVPSNYIETTVQEVSFLFLYLGRKIPNRWDRCTPA